MHFLESALRGGMIIHLAGAFRTSEAQENTADGAFARVHFEQWIMVLVADAHLRAALHSGEPSRPSACSFLSLSIERLSLDIRLHAAQNQVADAPAFPHAPAEVRRGDSDRWNRDRQDRARSIAEGR